MEARRCLAGAGGLVLLVGWGGCRPLSYESQRSAEKFEVRDRRARTDAALLAAVKTGDTAGAARALEEGANIEAPIQSGRTPLMLAALLGNAPLVSALLAKGANVKATDPSGMTALMWGAFGGRPDVLTALLRAGADPAAKDKNGKTALDWSEKPEAAALLRKSSRTR